MYSSSLHQYATAKQDWIAPFDYQEQHAGMRVRTALTHALAALYHIEPELAQTLCHCVERFNTASLVHDDIVDQDRIRRGAPSVWVKFGVAMALVSGMYGYIDGLQRLSALNRLDLVSSGLESLEALHVGQCLDTQISEGNTLPTLDEYRFVAQTNTGCFLSSFFKRVSKSPRYLNPATTS
ncbi:polyprenyl synthetase family protein [Pseudomonas sp. BW7P1]|uniref:polyprenyl synthetase family protein n=1 Tax=Pseudomonas TaxID=286 RepID=UPI0021AD8945|nr:polyprenyl synthetase family protein [Pseudomonas sp. BW7P1]UWI59644.1 polyprenyl synthetase family protein [Pseudomonas sp. BW7P1]